MCLFSNFQKPYLPYQRTIKHEHEGDFEFGVQRISYQYIKEENKYEGSVFFYNTELQTKD